MRKQIQPTIFNDGSLPYAKRNSKGPSCCI